MMNRLGLDRFKKASAAEPFTVTNKVSLVPANQQQRLQQFQVSVNACVAEASTPLLPIGATTTMVPTTAVGAGGSTWQPPDWAVDPKSGVYWLDVLKDGEVVDRISLDRRRLIFGRQQIMCDLVLDHTSVSRQHAALVHHKNGGIYGIDLGSAHGTFVANERLTKDNPVELEIGQTMRFAASTRMYVLRKSVPSRVMPVAPLTDNLLPPPPDASDKKAVLVYNTALNKLRFSVSNNQMSSSPSMPRRPGCSLQGIVDKDELVDRPAKKARKGRVSFRDNYGGLLAEIVGVSDGADVSTEPGPVGVREGSLVGKYESLVQVTVVPKGQEDVTRKTETRALQGVTQRLQQYLDKMKASGKGINLHGDIYGESLVGIAEGSWASIYNSLDKARSEKKSATNGNEVRTEKLVNGMGSSKFVVNENPTVDNHTKKKNDSKYDANLDDDDLFGEDEDT